MQNKSSFDGLGLDKLGPSHRDEEVEGGAQTIQEFSNIPVRLNPEMVTSLLGGLPKATEFEGLLLEELPGRSGGCGPHRWRRPSGGGLLRKKGARDNFKQPCSMSGSHPNSNAIEDKEGWGGGCGPSVGAKKKKRVGQGCRARVRQSVLGA